MLKNYITIKGAREHNLKSLDLALPRNKLIVITGLSGSGKSSLAFDTIYAEGQRRYVESLSAYARQFLEQLHKPDVEYIEGLSPAIAIEQRMSGANPRSTVATQTEIYDYLRLMFARIGTVYCYRCGREISQQSSEQIVDQILELPPESKLYILAPLIKGRKGAYRKIFESIAKSGFVRVRVDNQIYDINEPIKLNKEKKHSIEIVVDRLILKNQIRKRLTDSIETALKVGQGVVLIIIEDEFGKSEEMIFSQMYACTHCQINYEEFQPRMFSFNSPYGACSACGGLGTKMEIDEELVVPDRAKSLREGALEPWRRGGKGYLMYYRSLLVELANTLDFSMDEPFIKLPKATQKLILYGKDDVYVWGKPYEGIIPHLERLFKKTDSDFLKEEINKYMSNLPCPACKGARLKAESLAVRVGNHSIYEITKFSITSAAEFFKNLKLSDKKKLIAHQVLKEIKQRLEFMENVGLGYLTLDRQSSTLSGGEAQRIRLATQIGSRLTGVIYILDEPSIGLHQRDNDKLLSTLKTLRDLGNTLIVVEHDEATIRAADYIVDLGPGAGRHGGEIVSCGNLAQILKSETSLTARYLNSGFKIVPHFKQRKYKNVPCLEIIGASEHNLKDINVKIPLGVFVCITGVSGSGKSTLIDEILYRSLAKKLYHAKSKPGVHKKIKGIENIDKAIVIDQSPIGRTPRSNPATYTGVFSPVREFFAQLPEAKVRGYKPGRFSFNVKGGRCESCQGDGIKKIEMHFLPDVYVECEVCKGKRYNQQTLEVKYKGKSISEVLEMTVESALELFKNISKISNKMKMLHDVGLGYIQLGQSATTLSGGEAQRVKLSTELSRRATGKTLYILDEPTTGLHFADVDKLLKVLHTLVDYGNTIVIIEHNLDVIKTADYIIDLGPEGGEAGGMIVGCGSPRELMKNKTSYTGRYLKKHLSKH
ncbi:MAG: excinuclease ABC subunit UvrA [Candidatus Omnitrophota bacterium]